MIQLLPDFETFECAGENLSNRSSRFWKHKSVFFHILHHFSVPSNITPLQFLCTIFTQALYILVKISSLKCKFWRFLSARVKICQIHHVSFELTSQFHFKFFIIIQCNYTELLCKFLAHAFSTLGERISSKSQF